MRAGFVAGRGFPLDRFQTLALDAIDDGKGVLVAAPTGSGKTLVAEYAIVKARADGGKVFYTTPLKALSNQKYGDLVREHGNASVGLLTGDNAVNGDAPIVVMTTEVLRNMIYAASPALDGLRYVVLDEVHYLQNPYRGAVWEEVIIHLRPEVDLVCLSATVSNAEEVAAWIETVRGSTAAIIEEHRPVTLEHRYLVGERGTDDLHLLPTFVGAPDGELRPNPEAARLDANNARDPGWRGRPRSRMRTPSRVETAETLGAEGMLPAICVVFSRKGCDQAVQQCLAAGLRLTEPGERAQIRAIAEAKTSSLADADLEVLRYGEWLAGMEAGFAANHAGMVPPMKEAVEEAFAAGLVKMVFATETLSLGINMPARSVVIEKLSKFTGERHEFLTPGEYTQLTGRAGRRGIDERGYAIVCWSPFVPFDQVASLASRRSGALRSSFRPNYNMAANLVRRYTQFEAHHLLNLSFAQFHADRDVVTMERQLERTRDDVARQRALHADDLDAVQEFRALAAEVDGLRRNRGETRRITEAMEALRPGDVVVVRRKGGRVAVLSHEHRRGGGQPPGGPHAGKRRRAPRPAGLRQRRRAAPPRSTCPRPSLPATRRSGVRPPTACARPSSVTTTAVAPAATSAGSPSSRPRWRSTRWPMIPSASTSCGRRVRSSASNATSSAPSAACAAAARAWPASSTACCACWRRGATSTAGRSPTPASGWPASTPRPICSSPRRCARDCSTGSGRRTGRARVVLHLRAARPRRSESDAAGAVALEDRRQAGARDRAHRPGPARQRGRRRPPRDARARSRVHAVRARLGVGRLAGRRARRRRDDRRRLRAPREAVHRPAAPGRRRGGRSRDTSPRP